MDPKNKKLLSELVAELSEDEVIDEVKRCLSANVNPMEIIHQCREGIVQVGDRYEKRQYYISGLIMAGEIMQQVSELVLPALKERFVANTNGRVLIATVQGDIHHIGKNLVKVLLQCFGFSVLDAGEDVAPEEILKHALAFSPHIIGLSCLVSTAYDMMGITVSLLKKETHILNPQPMIIIGGMVDEAVCRHMGADQWTRDAMDGVRLCQKHVDVIFGDVPI